MRAMVEKDGARVVHCLIGFSWFVVPDQHFVVRVLNKLADR
jgi:hypothetical protein